MSKLPEGYKQDLAPAVAVNQVAYGVNNPKIAVAKDISGVFYLVNEQSGEAVFSAEARGPIFDKTNEANVYHFDFSEVTAPGRYFISTPEGRSYPFEISADPLSKVSYALLRMLYYQRCGCELPEKYAGDYAHGECHRVSAFVYNNPDEVIEDISGGWHDAGDYGRYVTPANQCIFNLLYAYELFPEGVNGELNIPESGNGVPDILNEARYELEWMLKMQDKKTGGVYHKCCTTAFAGNTLPQDDHSDENPMVLSQFSLQATAGFAAATAAAYRAYLPFDKAFAERCLAAARRAYDFALENEQTIPVEFKTIAPGGGGAYGDACAYDEFYWGAAELFRSTGDAKYEQHFKHYAEFTFSKSSYGAYNQGGHGSLCYCLTENADPEMKKKVLGYIVDSAEHRLEIGRQDGYLVALDSNEYYWGSNAVLANALSNMVAAAILTKTDRYDECMRESISYLLGRNIISKCYVTGFGSNPVMNPHHRPSMFDGVKDPVPGMLAGGPNDRPGQRPDNSEGVPSGGCFIDWEWNWTTNEITIYWNCAALFVTGYLNSDR